jgi:hypothetical protein
MIIAGGYVGIAKVLCTRYTTNYALNSHWKRAALSTAPKMYYRCLIKLIRSEFA